MQTTNSQHPRQYKPRLYKEKRSILFTQKQAEQLTLLTKNQLKKLDDDGLVVPNKEHFFSYTWNQIILLCIIYQLRQRWSYTEIQAAFKKLNLQEVLADITQLMFVAFVKDDDFVIKYFKIDDDLNYGKIFQIWLELGAVTPSDLHPESVFRLNKTASIIVPKLVDELIQRDYSNYW